MYVMKDSDEIESIQKELIQIFGKPKTEEELKEMGERIAKAYFDNLVRENTVRVVRIKDDENTEATD